MRACYSKTECKVPAVVISIWLKARCTTGKLFGLLAISFAFVQANTVQARPPHITAAKIEAIEQLVMSGMARSNVPGMAIALVEHGKIVYSKGFGSRDGDGNPVTPSNAFHLASATKPITAMMVLQLVEEGRVKLDDPVVKHLSRFRAKDPAQSSKITIRHLLNQTSGFTGYSGNVRQNDESRNQNALTVAVDELKYQDLFAEPGSTFEYSNSNFDILGLIIERFDQRSFEDSLAERVWKPLNMQDSFALKKRNKQQIAVERFRYWGPFSVHFDREEGRRLVAAGGASASANDIAKLLLDLTSDQPTLLTPDTLLAMTSLNQEDNGYALGWFVDQRGGNTLVYHDGMIAGSTTRVGYFPETKSGFVVLANTSIGLWQGNVRALEGAVVDILADKKVRSIQSPFENVIMFLGAVIIPILLALACFRTIWLLIKKKRTPLQWPLKFREFIYRLLVPIGALAGLFYGLAFSVPSMFDTSLSSLSRLVPDVGLLLYAGSSLATVLAALLLFSRIIPNKTSTVSDDLRSGNFD